MSLAGCNFICDNNDCKCYNTGFVLTGIWPLGNVDEIIEKTTNEEILDLAKKRKEAGFERIKITYPDPDGITIVSYAIEKFCKKCKRIEVFEVKNDQDTTPETCHICGEKYIDFNKATEDGLECPVCGEELKQNRWCVMTPKEEGEENE
jgi:transcription initiation factor IIE alpha subunit